MILNDSHPLGIQKTFAPRAPPQLAGPRLGADLEALARARSAPGPGGAPRNTPPGGEKARTGILGENEKLMDVG